jgi:hypothetical protein
MASLCNCQKGKASPADENNALKRGQSKKLNKKTRKTNVLLKSNV